MSDSTTFELGHDQGAPIASAVTIHRRIKRLPNGTIRHAAAGELCNGVASGTKATAGDRCDFRSIHIPGNLPMVAAAAITLGAYVYPAADGKVTATPNGPAEGIALSAAGADGDYVTVQPIRGQNVLSGSHTVTAGEAAANSNNGLATIDTLAGTTLGSVFVRVIDTSTGADNSGYVLAKLTGGSLGSFTVAGVASGIQLDAGDVIEWIAIV